MQPPGAEGDRPSGTITFLFTDIESSTQLWAQDHDAMAISLAHHDRILRSTIGAFGGYVFSTGGDGLGGRGSTAHASCDRLARTGVASAHGFAPR